MKASTRLFLILTMAVSAVMAGIGVYVLRQHAEALNVAARDEVRAHAITLRIALEEDYATGRQRDAQQLLDRLRENSDLFGVVLFDETGAPVVVSERMARAEWVDATDARNVIATGQEYFIQREINQVAVFSLILPLQLAPQRRGALELSLRVPFVESGIAQERRDILIFLAALCVTILLVVAVVTHYTVVKPVGELLTGAAALTRGELHHHVRVPSHNKEFSTLAQAFNSMADSLLEQHCAAALEAEERLRLERRLRHSERLAAVGHLAAGVAHEIGAPLQVIDGRAKQLQDQPAAPPAKHQRNLTIIRAQTERITRIVRNLLDLARPFHPRLRTVEVRPVLAQVLEACELQAAQAGVTLVHEPAPAPTLVTADAGLLQQVFTNICINALQAMPTGGVLRVGYDGAPLVKDGTAFVGVRVADTGGGIAAENLPQLFEPFFTTKAVGHGTGLGLAVSSRIIEEHGGWIEAANWPARAEAGGARGAQFSVFLPSAQPQSATELDTASVMVAQ